MNGNAGLLVRQYTTKRFETTQIQRFTDTVATEEPLQIALGHWVKDSHKSESLALTMRSPGDDCELAVGFLYSEGVVRSETDISEVRFLGVEPSNEIVVELAPGVDVQMLQMKRATFVNASCGVCGKTSIQALQQRIPPQLPGSFQVDSQLIRQLPALLKDRQEGFAQSGGLHAAALVDASGVIEKSFEDIGRHNALDKLIGWAVLNRIVPLEQRILFLSSRSSFELVQKAATAGAPILATVGSPSSLAIETARGCGLTLIGFVREGRFNVYSGDWRIH
ncbi:MAG TPA: formate dehydrogenase accessory sulfurtransferase FdhD [Bryobacteraceae bacterium]|jgi:FdhD protein|nr:formate dehydrogenase accessory sulfurtransferase FdhD [Bryobacteraceae bacterium]